MFTWKTLITEDMAEAGKIIDWFFEYAPHVMLIFPDGETFGYVTAFNPDGPRFAVNVNGMELETIAPMNRQAIRFDIKANDGLAITLEAV